jgi:hypothetical protein
MSAQVESYLTGRRRYREIDDDRSHTFLLLQVEKSVWSLGRWRCIWVDATPADVGKDELA